MSETALTKRELEIWFAVKKLGETVFGLIEVEIERESGLSGADYGVLSRLDDSGDGILTQQQLAATLGWSKSRLSHQLTRMQGRGLIARKASGREVKLTTLLAGRKALSVGRPAHAKALRKFLLKRLTKNEGDTLLSIFSELSN